MRNVWDRDPYRWYKYKKDWKAIVGQFRLDLRCCRQRGSQKIRAVTASKHKELESFTSAPLPATLHSTYKQPQYGSLSHKKEAGIL